MREDLLTTQTKTYDVLMVLAPNPRPARAAPTARGLGGVVVSGG